MSVILTKNVTVEKKQDFLRQRQRRIKDYTKSISLSLVEKSQIILTHVHNRACFLSHGGRGVGVVEVGRFHNLGIIILFFRDTNETELSH